MGVYTNVSLTATNSLPTRLKDWLNPPPGSLPQTNMIQGFLDVSRYPYYADKTGVTNARPAIQNAIDDAYDANLVVFLPSGTYLCEGGLSLIQTNPPLFASGRKFVNKLVGSTLGARPVLKLKDGAVVTNNLITGSAAADYPIFLYFAWQGVVTSLTEDPSRHYCGTLRGINIDMGNNPNVSAVRNHGAQLCAIEDVDIYGTAFAYGLDGIPGGGGSCSNVKITGGKVGVKLQYRPIPLLTGLQLYGQSQYGIWAKGAPQLAVVGFNIVGPTNPTPGYIAVYGFAALALVDGTIQVTNQASGQGIVCPSGSDVYLQNVYVKADTCISGGGATTIFGSETNWTQLSEYAVRAGSNNGQMVVRGTDYGASTNATVATVITNGITPPTNLVSQHLWTTSFPSWQDVGIINITNYGAVADNPTTNNAPYIQAALNAAGGTNTVFIPRGHFFVGGQINVPAGSKLIGASEAISVLQAMTNWIPTTNTSILSTADNPTNGVTLAHFAVVGNEPGVAGNTYLGSYPNMTSQSNVTFVTVQTGNTIWRDLQMDEKPASGSGVCYSSQSRTAFKGNAGGKVYNLAMDGGSAAGAYAAGQPPNTYHLINVQNITNTLCFYQPDPEHLDESAKVAIYNAGAVSLFGFKYEAAGSDFRQQLLSASNVMDLRVMGGYGNYNQATNALIALSQCTHVRIAVVSRNGGTNDTAGLLWFTGQGNTLTDQRDIALYSYDLLPTDLVLGTPTIIGGVLRLNFSGPAAQSFKVVGTNQLTAPVSNWPVLKTGIFGVGGPLNTNFTDPSLIVTNQQRFFRIVSP